MEVGKRVSLFRDCYKTWVFWSVPSGMGGGWLSGVKTRSICLRIKLVHLVGPPRCPILFDERDDRHAPNDNQPNGREGLFVTLGPHLKTLKYFWQMGFIQTSFCDCLSVLQSKTVVVITSMYH